MLSEACDTEVACPDWSTPLKAMFLCLLVLHCDGWPSLCWMKEADGKFLWVRLQSQFNTWTHLVDFVTSQLASCDPVCLTRVTQRNVETWNIQSSPKWCYTTNIAWSKQAKIYCSQNSNDPSHQYHSYINGVQHKGTEYSRCYHHKVTPTHLARCIKPMVFKI